MSDDRWVPALILDVGLDDPGALYYTIKILGALNEKNTEACNLRQVRTQFTCDLKQICLCVSNGDVISELAIYL